MKIPGRQKHNQNPTTKLQATAKTLALYAGRLTHL